MSYPHICPPKPGRTRSPAASAPWWRVAPGESTPLERARDRRPRRCRWHRWWAAHDAVLWAPRWRAPWGPWGSPGRQRLRKTTWFTTNLMFMQWIQTWSCYKPVVMSNLVEIWGTGQFIWETKNWKCWGICHRELSGETSWGYIMTKGKKPNAMRIPQNTLWS